MQNTIEKAKELMEQGWKAREDLKFPLAKKLLTQAKALFEEQNDLYNITETLNHLAYTQKLKSQQILDKGGKLVKKAIKIAKEHATKDASILRAKMSLEAAQGKYEQALVTANTLLPQYTKPANQADILQHIAMYELRCGNIENALNTITKAEDKLQEGWNLETDPSRSIWRVSILLTKGLIFLNRADIKQAKDIGKEALKIATDAQLKTKILQTKEFLSLIKIKQS